MKLRRTPRLRYGPRELAALARHPPGRFMLRQMLFWSLWPLLGPAAGLWRRTVARRLRLAAVTGSFGKTSTARLVAAALDLDPEAIATNFGSYLATAMLRTRSGETRGVFEVGISRRRQMSGYARMLRPDVVVVTAVGSEHRGAIGDLERVRDEKAKLLRGLRPGGIALLNGDDPRTRGMSGRTSAQMILYGYAAECAYRGVDVAVVWPRGTRFRARTPRGEFDVHLRLFGEHNVRAALAALAVAEAYQLDLEGAIARLGAVPPAPGRLEPVALPSGAWLLCDEHKSGRETYDAAFDLLAEIPASRRLMVLGDVTEPEGSQRLVHREIGRLAASVASRLVLVGNRGKNVASGARSAGLDPTAISVLRTAGEATNLLASELGPGDVALVKGRTNDKLERIRLALTGREVRCDLRRCNMLMVRCSRCAMLERGWQGRTPVT